MTAPMGPVNDTGPRGTLPTGADRCRSIRRRPRSGPVGHAASGAAVGRGASGRSVRGRRCAGRRAPASPRNSAGRVNCGSSSRPSAPKLSVTGLAALPIAPSRSRVTASITRHAATSPPLSTTSPTLISPSTQMGTDPMVDPLVAATQQAEPVEPGQLVGESLIERSPAGPEQEQRARRSRRLDRVEDRLGLHDHARASPERSVVDGAVHVARVLADVVTTQVEQTRTAGLAQQALAAEHVDEAGEQGEHVDPHRRDPRQPRSNRPSGTSTVMMPSRFDTTNTVGTSAPDSSSRMSDAGLAMTATHATAVGAVDLDDVRPDELVHPERVGVVDRGCVQRHVGEPLGRGAIGDLGELHDATAVRGDPRRFDGQLTVDGAHVRRPARPGRDGRRAVGRTPRHATRAPVGCVRSRGARQGSRRGRAACRAWRRRG